MKFSELKPGDTFKPNDSRWFTAQPDRGRAWQVRKPFAGIRYACMTTDGQRVGDFDPDCEVDLISRPTGAAALYYAAEPRCSECGAELHEAEVVAGACADCAG
jgi:hypothetical protein